MHAQGRVVVLLGAGASADAGLPLTAQLAEQVIRAANDRERGGRAQYRSEWVRALNFVYSAMVGYQGLRGDDPLRAVNIETLISALRLLKARDTHEVAPFVATWSSGLSDLASSETPTSEGKKILDAVGKSIAGRGGFADRDVAEAVAEIARAAYRPDLGHAFSDAEEFVLSELVRLLGSPTTTGYFSPLFDLAASQPGGLDVLTLNYDLTVELAALAAGVPVERAIASWRPGAHLVFPRNDGEINLIKIHGSLDWELDADPRGARHPLQPPSIGVVDTLAKRPWIVVGDREKLATDGPTLPLLVAAQDALARADHLAVVGYSFGDAHVNSPIRDWLFHDSTRTISILDKSWPPLSQAWTGRDFRETLLTLLGRPHSIRGSEEVTPARLTALTGTASAKLDEVLRSRPSAPPDPYAAVDAHAAEGGFEIRLRLLGPPLSSVSVFAERLPPDRRPVGRDGVGLFADRAPFLEALGTNDPVKNVGARFESWQTDEELTVYAATHNLDRVAIHVSASTPVGHHRFVLDVAAADPARG